MTSLPVLLVTSIRLPDSTTLTSSPGTVGVTDRRLVWRLVALTPDTLWAEAGTAERPTQARAAAATRRVRRMAFMVAPSRELSPAEERLSRSVRFAPHQGVPSE